MSRPTVVVMFTSTPMAAYVKGYGTRELLTELRGRAPVWATRQRAWCVTERTARDLIAVAESRGIAVAIRAEAEGVDR